MKLFGNVLLMFCCLQGTRVVAQETPYYQVFFENSNMPGDYFYSKARYTSPAWIENRRGRLPVSDSLSFTPGNSLELHYVSQPGGTWEAAVQFAAWRGKDFLQASHQLQLRLYMPAGMPLQALPEIGISTKDSVISAFIPLKDFIKTNVPGKWLAVNIPLTSFKDVRYKQSQDVATVHFRQPAGDSGEHRIWIDQLELVPRATAGAKALPVPRMSQAKGYERHVDVAWQLAAGTQVRYIKIYRSVNGKPYRAVGIQSPWMQRYTDFTGQTGVKYSYRISVLDNNYNESALSAPVSAQTHTMTDDQLLDMVQEASFRYYWDGAEPQSGLALENIPGRRTMIAAGASGFGVMALLTGIERGFITRKQGIDRFKRIITFLEKADTYHGAFSHFMDGSTGKTVPFFGDNDNGGDLVETSFLLQGLLAARQFFNGTTADEQQIRHAITNIWEGVEWSWYKRYPDNKYLFWHWSVNHGWIINHELIGWNETMITYLLAIASPTHGVDAEMYYSGWASQEKKAQEYRKGWGQTDDGKMYSNGNTYYGIRLDAGVSNGGPLFFTHYPFLGLNPHDFSDRYTNYFTNNRNITLINYRYCLENPGGYPGYGPGCWGLTASDGPDNYQAREPVLRTDDGTMAPTGALSAFPYTPEQSMAALKQYYREYGSFLWGEYGFRDAFNLQQHWCAPIYMGLNQAPVTVMIENYRSGLLWKLFMQDPDIKKMISKMNNTK